MRVSTPLKKSSDILLVVVDFSGGTTTKFRKMAVKGDRFICCRRQIFPFSKTHSKSLSIILVSISFFAVLAYPLTARANTDSFSLLSCYAAAPTTQRSAMSEQSNTRPKVPDGHSRFVVTCQRQPNDKGFVGYDVIWDKFQKEVKYQTPKRP